MQIAISGLLSCRRSAFEPPQMHGDARRGRLSEGIRVLQANRFQRFSADSKSLSGIFFASDFIVARDRAIRAR